MTAHLRGLNVPIEGITFLKPLNTYSWKRSVRREPGTFFPTWHMLCDGFLPLSRQGICVGLSCSFRGCRESVRLSTENTADVSSVLSQSSDEHSGRASASLPSPPCLFPGPDQASGQLSVGGARVSNLKPGALRAGGVWAGAVCGASRSVEASRGGGRVTRLIIWSISPRPLLLSRLWTWAAGMAPVQARTAG